MATIATPVSPKAVHLDVRGFAPRDIVPDALLLQASNVAGFVEGDEPAVRVPYVDFDDDVAFVPEGNQITESAPDYSEVVINTGKVAVLARVSREQGALEGSRLITTSMQRSLMRKANSAFLSQAAPTAPAVTPPAGILSQSPTAGGTVATDLDVVVDALATIEAAYGTATHVIASPSAWASLRKFKTATGSNESLVGAGVDDARKTLLGVPVLVNAAMTADQIVILDRDSVLSAAGQIQVAVSNDFYFDSDSAGIRVIWRFGQKIVDTSRVVLLTVTDPDAV